jgi:hypothetical protein
MRLFFEAPIDEYQKSGSASVAMMEAFMNQCLIEVLRAAEAQSGGSLPWLSALDDPRSAREQLHGRIARLYRGNEGADIRPSFRKVLQSHTDGLSS